MSYLDRLRPGRYWSPSGAEFTFEFRDLQRAGGKKAAVHEFPQQDLPEVQDLGQSTVHFALELIFTGQDYDLVADPFWEALNERGPATLMHPRWGDITVLPLSILQTEAFVAGMRRATFQVDFVRTGDLQFPTSSTQVESQVGIGLDDFEGNAAAAFGEDIAPEDALETAAVRGDMLSVGEELDARMTETVAENEERAEEFRRKVSNFQADIDELVAEPAAMTQSYLELARLPGRSGAAILTKVKSFGGLIEALAVGGSPGSPAEAAALVLQLFGALSGLAESGISGGEPQNRSAAIESSEAVGDALETAITAIEAIEAAVDGYAAPIELLSTLQGLVGQVAALLLERGFGLAVEQRAVLDGDRTPLDLVYELINPQTAEELETALDDFIAQNNLHGDEILLIPRGRKVVYYDG